MSLGVSIKPSPFSPSVLFDLLNVLILSVAAQLITVMLSLYGIITIWTKNVHIQNHRIIILCFKTSVLFLKDVQKEREPHIYLSKEEVKEKIQSYNSSVTDKLKMTLVSFA